jgi:hypothetical protein
MLLSRPPQLNTARLRPADPEKDRLVGNLLKNEISADQLNALGKLVTSEDLSDIIQHIYDLNEKNILELSALDGILRKLDDLKNKGRNRRFMHKIKREFRNNTDTRKKVILAEGDSWFNYPIILTDVIDRIAMEKDFAVYSLASGGDWLLNMLTAQRYVEELSVLHPDVFLISGGGNDLVGCSRLAAIVQTVDSGEFAKNAWAVNLITHADKEHVPLDQVRFQEGIAYLSRDFFALLMFFHLQYSFLINGILKNAQHPGDKFYPIQIITQGYDYAIPSYHKNLGPNPLLWYVPFVRAFLGHGSWLKTPLLTRGIREESTQRNILYAMIYLFNEMMIWTGAQFNRLYPNSVFHIDSRGSVGDDGWTDELHPRATHFLTTGGVFVNCIKDGVKSATYGHVYVVNSKKKT